MAEREGADPKKSERTRTAEGAPDATRADRADSYRRDLALVQGALAEEPGSLDELSRRLECVPSMLASRNSRIGRPLDEHELADLSQEVLVRIWRKLASFAGRSRLETWVYGICRLELMNSSRKKRGLGRPVIQLSGDALPEPVASDPSPGVDFEHIHQGLERLGPPEEDIVRLKHFDDLTFEEIGRALGISPNTAKTQYYRGLERLRVLLRATERDET